MQNEASIELAKERRWPLAQLYGQHDDLWQNTQSYIDLMKKYLA